MSRTRRDTGPRKCPFRLLWWGVGRTHCTKPVPPIAASMTRVWWAVPRSALALEGKGSLLPALVLVLTVGFTACVPRVTPGSVAYEIVRYDESLGGLLGERSGFGPELHQFFPTRSFGLARRISSVTCSGTPIVVNPLGSGLQISVPAGYSVVDARCQMTGTGGIEQELQVRTRSATAKEQEEYERVVHVSRIHAPCPPELGKRCTVWSPPVSDGPSQGAR